MLLLKLLLVPGLVAAVTVAVRRWGPAVGGWLAGLPVVAGPVLVFYALEQGTLFAARAANGTLTGLIATVAFVVAYASASARWSWPACVALGWTTFAAVVLTLHAAQLGSISSLAAVVAATSAASGLRESQPRRCGIRGATFRFGWSRQRRWSFR